MLVIGLMSGTSADGVDAALVEWPDAAAARPFRLVAFEETPFEPALQQRIHRFAAGRLPGTEVLRELAGLDVALGERFAAAAQTLARGAGVPLERVAAIASHGQTVAHHPELRATLQIGDPSVIAERTGRPVAVYQASMALKSEDTEDGRRRIFGKASTATVDRQGTIVDQETLKSAARKYLKRQGKIFYNHNWSVPIGRAMKMEHDGDALAIEAEIGKGFPVPVQSMAGFFGGGTVTLNVDDIWSMIQQGLLSSYSIGFSADEQLGEIGKDGKRKPTTLMVTDMFELSVVTIPANPDAEFMVTKSVWPSGAKAERLSREELWGVAAVAAAESVEVSEDDGQIPSEAAILAALDGLKVDSAGDLSVAKEAVERWLATLKRS